MHEHFVLKNPNISCSYDLYRSLVQSLNISFAKLGNEECETCEKFHQHNKDHTSENLNPDCIVCNEWSTHHKKYVQARGKYNIDDENAYVSSDTAYYSCDLQKVIMLPQMNEFKVVAFTRRIIAFNQSFVPIGSSQSNKVPCAIIWNEEVTGRKKEDIVSAYHAFFLKNRDKKKIVLWLDNCSAQNKNWCFFSFLIYIVNSLEVETDVIELNYFEPGHTFMSADSFHHQVEQSLKKMKDVYDFQDFENAVRNSNSKNVVVQSRTPSNIRKWIDYSSQHKLNNQVGNRPYLHDMKQIRVKRGSYNLSYNLTYDEQENLPELNFLKVKIIRTGIHLPETIKSPRGIPEQKKKDIIEKLVPLMPQSRRSFWYNLKTSNVPDLIETYENGEE